MNCYRYHLLIQARLQARAMPKLPDISPEGQDPEGERESLGRGGVAGHLMGNKRMLSGPYRTIGVNLDVFSWSTHHTIILLKILSAKCSSVKNSY